MMGVGGGRRRACEAEGWRRRRREDLTSRWAREDKTLVLADASVPVRSSDMVESVSGVCGSG